MKELTKGDIKKIVEFYNKSIAEECEPDDIFQSLRTNIKMHFEKKCVLGFDIYRYSQFALLQQSLIPHIFKSLYEQTLENCLKREEFFFPDMTYDSFYKNFIDTGDGGFQIFDSPFQAIIFAIYFQANIKRYNSGNSVFLDSIRVIVGELTLRYAITYDDLCTYNKNYYGPAIINNARIMSKDQLNRILVDENTDSWFTENVHGIENLQSLDVSDLLKTKAFKDFKGDKTLLFSKKNAIHSSHILKIGEIKSKLNILSIFSIYIKVLLRSGKPDSLDKYTVSLGNLNASGLS